MSPKDLLREFRALPVEQQLKFLSQASAPRRGAGFKAKRARKVAWPDVESRARQTTGGRVLPNLVIVDRDDSAFSGTSYLKLKPTLRWQISMQIFQRGVSTRCLWIGPPPFKLPRG